MTEQHSYQKEILGSKKSQQIIMENLFDPFSQDWLTHSTSNDKLERILEQGILSEGFVNRAIGILGEEIKKRINVLTLWPEFQSKGAISTYLKPKRKADLIVKFWSNKTAIVFSRHKSDIEEGMCTDEIICKWRVAPRRFKFLVVDADFEYSKEIFGDNHRLDYYRSLAQKYFLPICDPFFNLLWPMRISDNELQTIGIENLKTLCKKVGFEKLEEMSIEEIKTAVKNH